jgi:8-oxo-dGTP diphosphatase
MLQLIRRRRRERHAEPVSEPVPPAGPRPRAGGVVLAMVDDQLCVAAVQPARHPDGAWCLPKGKIDDGEAPLGTALREVREETGLICESVEHLETIEYTVERDGQAVARTAEYWLMAPIGGELGVPGDGPPGEIRAAAWRAVDDPDGPLTHPVEADLVARVVARLRADAG